VRDLSYALNVFWVKPSRVLDTARIEE